jgi:FAD/FMN-containing dehydrogenase
MADEDMLERRGAQTWRNWHDTVPGRVAGIDTAHYPSDTPPYGSAAINRCTQAMQRSIADARARGLTYRAVGRGWSLSTAPLTDGVLLDSARLKGKKRLTPEQLDPGFSGGAGRAARLCLVQCGNYVSELGQWLESDRNGLSFATTGAANGQTIIGASATGTHGSALDGPGALHDQIVAIHLLAGEGRQFWLERASDRVIRPTLPLSIGAELVRDDTLFHAVVMGLGAFGIIHNVVVEARSRFLLRAYN